MAEETQADELLKNLFEQMYAVHPRDRHDHRWVTDYATWDAILRIPPSMAYPKVVAPLVGEPGWSLLGRPVEFDGQRAGITFEPYEVRRG